MGASSVCVSVNGEFVSAARQSAANLAGDASDALPRRRYARWRWLSERRSIGTLPALAAVLISVAACSTTPSRSSALLLHPDVAKLNRPAPEVFSVRLETSKGPIVIEVHRNWAPHGADRFYNLVRAGYYDDNRFFRVIQGRWAQFGINGDPKISTAWRASPIPDDPRVESNVRGTVAFAFAVANGRTTQVFINLKDNSATHDREPFVPFGKVIEGMEIADALNSEYGESAGSGIRSGKQGPIFEEGNVWLERHFPRLDYIVKATVLKQVAGAARCGFCAAFSGATDAPALARQSPIPSAARGPGRRERGIPAIQNQDVTLTLLALALPAGWGLPFSCSKQLRSNHTTYS